MTRSGLSSYGTRILSLSSTGFPLCILKQNLEIPLPFLVVRCLVLSESIILLVESSDTVMYLVYPYRYQFIGHVNSDQ